MKTNSKFYALIALVTITAFGCKKDTTPAPSPSASGGITSFASFSQQYGAPNQNFTISTASAQMITGAKGVTVSFPANCFVTMAGAPVTGTVNVTLKEILKKKDMLLSDVTTMSETSYMGSPEPLISGGEISVTATQNGNPLRLAPNVSYRAFLPSSNAPLPGMMVFTTRATSNGLIWDMSGDTLRNNIQTSTVPQGLFMNCDSLGFGNADQFMSAPNYTNITLNITGTYDPTQIKAYAWYDNANTVWPFWHAFNTSGNNMTDNHTATGVPIHLIVISLKNGQLYTAIQPATLVGNDVFTLNLTLTNASSFQNTLAQLP